MASKEEGTCAPHSTCPKQLGIGHAGSQPACGLQWPRLEVWRLGSCQLQSRFVSPSSNSIPLPWPHFGFAAPPPARHKKDTATPRHRDEALGAFRLLFPLLRPSFDLLLCRARTRRSFAPSVFPVVHTNRRTVKHPSGSRHPRRRSVFSPSFDPSPNLSASASSHRSP